MLAAFQGFTTPHGGKKTRQDAQVIYQPLLNIIVVASVGIPGVLIGQSK